MPVDGRFAAVEETFTIAPPPRSLIAGQHGAQRPHRAHHVDLPGALPVASVELVEAADLGPADVVHEAVDPAEALERRRDDAARARRAAERSAATCRSPMPSSRAARGDDRARLPPAAARATSRPMPRGRAGDDADLVPEAEVHRGGYLSRRDDDPPRPARRDRLEPRARWQGHADPPLNDAGRAQARALGEAARRPGARRRLQLDLARARETAEIVAGALGLAVALDARLREVDVGEWSGLTHDGDRERFPEGCRSAGTAAPGWERGETYEAMGERVVAALLEIARGAPGRPRPRRHATAAPMRARLAGVRRRLATSWPSASQLRRRRDRRRGTARMPRG